MEEERQKNSEDLAKTLEKLEEWKKKIIWIYKKYSFHFLQKIGRMEEERQKNSEEGNEDLDYLRIELLRKRIQEQEKSGQKYVIFVVALPLIGVIGLSILGALNYEYNSFQGEQDWKSIQDRE